MVRAIDRADVTVRPMAFKADLLLRPRFARNVNGTIEVAEHGVVQLFYTVELGLEVSSRAGPYMAFDTRNLRVRGVLGCDKLRLHRDMTALTTKIDRLGVLISFVTAKGSQKKKANSAAREQRQDPSIAFARQIDLKNTVFLFEMRCATLRTFLQDRAQKCECEAEKEKKRCNDIRKDPNVRILYGSEEIDREEIKKSEERGGGQNHAGPTEPVLEMTPERWGLCSSCSLRHRGNYLAARGKIERFSSSKMKIRLESTAQTHGNAAVHTRLESNL